MASINGSLTLCTGQSTMLTASNASNYQWSTGQTTPSISVSAAGPYSVTVNAGTGCSSTTTVTVTNTNLSAPAISASSTSITTGQSTTLTASNCTGILNWFQSASAVGTGTSLVVSPTASTTYSANCSLNGCTSDLAAPLAVSVNAPVLNAPTLTASSLSICAGQSTTLTATGCAGSVTWSEGTTGNTLVVSPASSTTYTATCSASGQTSPSALPVTVSVNVLPLASITPSANLTICPGNSTALTASGGSTYRWSTGQTTPSVSVSTAGPYSVTVTDASNCANTASTALAIGSQPTATISGPSAICAGQSGATLTASGGSTYRWSTGATTAGLSVSVAGPYSVTVSDGASCSTTATATLSVNPQPTASITGGLSFCAGQSGSLIASGGSVYLWSTGQTTPSISVNAAGPYSVTVTNATGCSAMTTATVTVNTLASPTITAISPAYCQDATAFSLAGNPAGGSFTVDGQSTSQINPASLSVGSHLLRYTITQNGCSAYSEQAVVIKALPNAAFTGLASSYCANAGAVTLSPTTAGGSFSGPGISGASFSPASAGTGGTISYSVSSNGCVNTSSRSVTINPLPVPVISGNLTICSGTTTPLTASGGSTYLWSTGGSTASIDAATVGTYSVTVTNSLGCSAATSANLVVTPVIVSVSPSQSVRFSTRVTLSVVASGPDLSYRWYLGSTSGGNEVNENYFSTGTTTASLSLFPISPGPTYYYYVKVSSGVCSTFVGPIQLTVTIF